MNNFEQILAETGDTCLYCQCKHGKEYSPIVYYQDFFSYICENCQTLIYKDSATKYSEGQKFFLENVCAHPDSSTFPYKNGSPHSRFWLIGYNNMKKEYFEDNENVTDFLSDLEKLCKKYDIYVCSDDGESPEPGYGITKSGYKFSFQAGNIDFK